MARQLRREYEGAIYHVINRGDRRERIFEDDEDHEGFLKTLGEACGRAGWWVHAYCLMGNHFHLVMETPQPTLVAGMKWMLGTYTQRYNRRHRVGGHLFAGRYKSLIVDGSDNCYLRTVCDYVHLNPARAGLLEEDSELADYRWSSYPEYLKTPTRRLGWLRVDRVFGELGIGLDNTRGRKEFRRYMEARVQNCAEEDVEFKSIRRGWKFGADDFVERLEALTVARGKRESYVAGEFGETMEVKAHRIIEEEVAARGVNLEAITKLAKTDPEKAKIAQRLRRETPLSHAWIAEALNAGTPGTLMNTLNQLRKKNEKMRD